MNLITEKLPKFMTQSLFSQVWIGVTRTVTLTSLTVLATTAISNQPSYARSATFYCGKSKGVPVTFARTQDGIKRAIIHSTTCCC
ncbi:MAG: hypothetical protein RLZZ507_1368 [Cyanobacteriota bacterium]|jgi:hypothetical protein